MEGFSQSKRPVSSLEDKTRTSMREAVVSRAPVHGIGRERLSSNEFIEVEAFFSKQGADINDPFTDQLTAEEWMDIYEYAKVMHDSQKRKEVGNDGLGELEFRMRSSIKRARKAFDEVVE
ncbi:hypothetical protein H0X32_00390 [Patescibacteria group bacterium]|nr:hypothetical protein [Patescibacteria group bacterium]